MNSSFVDDNDDIGNDIDDVFETSPDLPGTIRGEGVRKEMI